MKTWIDNKNFSVHDWILIKRSVLKKQNILQISTLRFLSREILERPGTPSWENQTPMPRIALRAQCGRSVVPCAYLIGALQVFRPISFAWKEKGAPVALQSYAIVEHVPCTRSQRAQKLSQPLLLLPANCRDSRLLYSWRTLFCYG